MKAGVTVLGSTGTIGCNTLDVISRNPGRYEVIALSANTDTQRMTEQCQEWQPAYAVMADENAAEQLKHRLDAVSPDTQVLQGNTGLETISTLESVDQVMAGIVGAAGLCPTLAAAKAGKRVLLANKEALVMSGDLFMQTVRESGAELLPIDSEHNAIFQCMPVNHAEGLAESGVEHILLTASGGPFRTFTPEQLAHVTPAQACAHPNWVMGQKISVDSASMMNKGLEVIEACWLFNTTADKIKVVIHPQSIIHSMVQYTDGSVLAELGHPDMRTPIAHAMAWPERHASGVAPLDMFSCGSLDFERPDLQRFPCLRLAFEAAEAGGTASTILNAANEIAVENFLQNRLRFLDIAAVIEEVLSQMTIEASDSIEHILQVDQQARELASSKVAGKAGLL